MDNKNLFKEAIADAKAVREAALANAKAALEEALTPKLQSMLAAKLNEMEYEMEEEGLKDDEEMEEGMYPDDTSDEIQDKYRATGAALEEEELEEEDILDKFIKTQKGLKSPVEKEKSPFRTTGKTQQISLEDIPEVTRRVGARDSKSMITSRKNLGKCFGLFK